MVRLWDPTSGAELAAQKAGAQWVDQLAWSPHGDLLASAAGKSVRLWSPDGAMVREIGPLKGTISALTWEPGAGSLCCAVHDSIMLWKPDRDAPLLTLGWDVAIVSLAWSPDGDFLAAGGDVGVVHLWVMPMVEEVDFTGYWSKVRELSWDPASHRLATGGGPSVVVWTCSTGGPPTERPFVGRWHRPAVRALAFQHHASVLASGGADARLSLWRAEPRERIALSPLDSGVTCLSWSSDDTLLAAGTEQGSVAVFRP
jgi:WD40 repeat protein